MPRFARLVSLVAHNAIAFAGLLSIGCASSTQSGGDQGGAGVSGAGGSAAASGGASTGGVATSGGGTPASTGGTSTSGGNSSGGASTTSGGNSSGGAGNATGGQTGVTSKCDSPVGPGLPSNAPVLQTGVWKEVGPTNIDWGNGPFTQGLAVDPCNPAVLYITSDAFDVSLGGLFKSTDAGATWTRIGKTDGTDKLIDEPIRIRIDPKNTQHLYVGDGVRGGTMGFRVSTDGGATFNVPQAFKDLQTTQGLYQWDVYDVATDPTDFDHVLVAFHGSWGWTDTKWNMSSGVLESTDGGQSWIVHPPNGWGTGHAINFLYNPELGLGDSKTWLLGTQGAGMLRTTDAGATWTKVTSISIQHGGGTLYYAKNGDLYASSSDTIIRSSDNGLTWAKVGPGGGYNGVGGDGTRIYSSKCFGPTHMISALESNGTTWADYNSQSFQSGSFEFGFDATNKILYTASWGSGMWALKVE